MTRNTCGTGRSDPRSTAPLSAHSMKTLCALCEELVNLLTGHGLTVTVPPFLGSPKPARCAMSFTETVLLGALAGFTIYLGLPIGRLQALGSHARVALT